ncbi:MAG: glycosyltransferase family 9 protein [Burkholderiaceae bacterium]
MSCKFLLVRTDRIGDTVLTLPAVTALRDQFPDCHLSFLARSYTEPLLKRYAGIDEVRIYDPEGPHQGWSGMLRLAEELRREQFDAAVLFHPRPELALPLFLARIPLRVGSADRWYRFLFTHAIRQHRSRCERHEGEYNQELITPLLATESTPALEFHFQPAQVSPIRQLFPDAPEAFRYAVIHPGSGGSAPNLSGEQYRMCVEVLLEETDWRVVLTGGVGDRGRMEQIAAGLASERVHLAPGGLSLEQLLDLIAGASLLIGSSTGPLHLADAMGTPLLGFYCPAVPYTPDRWGPYQQREWVITSPVQGPRRCDSRRCPNGKCLELLSGVELRSRLQKRLQTAEAQDAR